MRFRTIAIVVGAGVLATGTVGYVAAQESDDDGGPPAPPGTPWVEEAPQEASASEPGTAGDFAFDETIQTGSSTFEPQTLTKFIAGTEFDAFQGAGAFADIVDLSSGSGDSCVSPDSTSGGDLTEWFAGVDLPDGSKVTKIIAYGEDSDATWDMEIRLDRTTYNVPIGLAPPAPPPTPTRTDDIIDTFSTSGVSGDFALSGADLDVVTGSKSSGGGIFLTGVDHQFFSIHVEARNSADTDHVLCGVEVLYQVPTASDPGTVFHPLENPIRAYDGRIGAIPQSGSMAPNTSKVISIKDGYDSAGAVSDANAVPSTATAVTYNITVAAATDGNFMSVTPGDAGSFTASAINYQGGSNVANAGTVGIDGSRQIKVFNGDGPGTAFAIIDITGWYGPPIHPNMGN